MARRHSKASILRLIRRRQDSTEIAQILRATRDHLIAVKFMEYRGINNICADMRDNPEPLDIEAVLRRQLMMKDG